MKLARAEIQKKAEAEKKLTAEVQQWKAQAEACEDKARRLRAQ